jgi:glycosyltransferase involved in cell wall biosynthesis
MAGSSAFVLTYHAGPIRKGRPLLDAAAHLYEETVMRFTARRADSVICNSEYVHHAFVSKFRGKTVVITPGVDVSLFHPAGPGKPGSVIFVAQLDIGMEFKNLDLLLQATRSLVDSGLDMTLEVVGSGALMAQYEQSAAQLGLGPDRVRFAGQLAGADLVAAYQRSSVAALPSTYESFGMSLAEAMACGLPVVASRTGGIPALVDDGRTGLLVEPGSLDELAGGLRQLIEDPARAGALGRAGRRRIEAEFDWKARVRATHEVFVRTLDHRAGPATVAIVSPRYPPDIGGVERYSSHVAEGLRGSGALQPLVITTRPGLRTRYEDGAVPVIRLGAWIKVFNTPLSPLWPIQLRRLVRTRDVTVLNVHSPVPGLADIATAVSGDRPVIMTYHAGSMVKGRALPDFCIRAYEQHVLPRVLDRCEKVVVVSPMTRVSDRPGAEMVPPGVDLELFSFTAECPTAPPRLLFVGRLDSGASFKGENVLFAALERVARTVPQVRLEVVGDGAGRPAWVATAAEHGLEDIVAFTGPLSGPDLVAAYHRASIVVLPSVNEAESFGMCLIEAMACGRAVIGSRIGGIPFTIDDGSDGLLVPPGDEGALAAAIIELLGDRPRRAALGIRGRRKVEARFSITALQAAYENIFLKLVP